MTPGAKVDTVIAKWLAEGPTTLDPAERRAIAHAAEMVAQRRTRFPVWRPAARPTALLGAAAMVVVLATSPLLPALRQLPIFGGPAPTASPTPLPSSGGRACQTGVPNPEVRWSGPLRSDLAGMPNCQGGNFPDARGDALEGIDILMVSGSRGRQWALRLAGFPPAADSLDPAEMVVEYGLVFETTGDDVADYVIGINNDAPVRGNYRVWVTRLATNSTTEIDGPPYGTPVDFVHPDEVAAGPDTAGAGMSFFFLVSPPWAGTGDSGAYIPGDVVRFYAWASMTSGDDVLAWDYAPDYGWSNAGTTR